MSFDAIGRVATQIDAKGQVKTMTYDPVGQTLETRYADGTIVSQTFDRIGRRTTMTDWAGATTYAFTPRSELSGKTDPGGLAQSYEYDPNGNRTLLVDPDGGRFTSTYDMLDRPTKQIGPLGRTFTAVYDPDSRITTIISSFGSTRKIQLDALGRATTQIEYDSALNPVVTVIDAFDGAGRKTSSNRDGLALAYSYDPASRLTGEQGTGRTATFAYDPASNITVKQHQGSNPITMAYDPADQLTTATFGNVVYATTWDANGNRTTESDGMATTGYVWDPENRERKMTTPDGSIVTSTYSGDGLRRTVQKPGQNVSTIVWDGTDYLQER